MNWLYRRWARRTALAVVLIGALVFLRGSILAGLARAVTVTTPPTQVDLIVPLYHDPLTIPAATVDLLRRGYAGRIGLYRPRPRRLEAMGLLPHADVIWRRILESQGVPPHAIVEIGHDIRDETGLAEAMTEFFKSQPRSRILFVASAPRSRLAWASLRRAFERTHVGISIYAVAPAGFDERNWWQSRDGVVTYFDAYALWLLRAVR